ncbi:MAG: hypothetical protein K8T26_18615 [Lentisphaerae bacterium]|nr:hypothetical protein [Lentisphaerota bacterium]
MSTHDEAEEFERSTEHPHHGGHCFHEKDWGIFSAWQSESASKLDRILAHAAATNGRVTALETSWAFAKGAIAVIVLLELVPKLVLMWRTP